MTGSEGTSDLQKALIENTVSLRFLHVVAGTGFQRARGLARGRGKLGEEDRLEGQAVQY